MARDKNWSYTSYDEAENISVIGNYIWDSNSLAWIKQTAAAAGGGGPVSIADGLDTAEGTTTDAAWVSGNGTVISLLKAIAGASGSGGLTDVQLRATPVPVSGPLTDLQLRASAVAISGTVSISGTVPVSGPLTDAQLRAAAVPVSGPLTDAQLRAVPVPVSGTVGVTGVATESTLATRLSEADFDTKTGALTETAPATDTASSGLNGRLQRIAQRLTSLIALLPAALVGGRLDVNIGAPATLPVSIAGSVAVTGPLTDAQLRATPVPSSISSIDGEGSIASAQVSVTTTAGTVVAARAGRRSLLIVNHGTTDVFLGPATVTVANGILLPGVKGASISIPTTALVQGIVAAGAQTVSYIEVF